MNKLKNTLELLLSGLSALFGIQTDQNRERDFSKRSPMNFVILGIIMVIVLVLGMVIFVNQLTP